MFIEIVSPEKTIFTGDVNSVYLPGTEGFFQILNNKQKLRISIYFYILIIKYLQI